MTVYHGTYERTVQDLPIFQKKVSLSIKAYEYYCANEACETTTFSEDYEGFISRCGRMKPFGRLYPNAGVGNEL